LSAIKLVPIEDLSLIMLVWLRLAMYVKLLKHDNYNSCPLNLAGGHLHTPSKRASRGEHRGII